MGSRQRPWGACAARHAGRRAAHSGEARSTSGLAMLVGGIDLHRSIAIANMHVLPGMSWDFQQ